MSTLYECTCFEDDCNDCCCMPSVWYYSVDVVELDRDERLVSISVLNQKITANLTQKQFDKASREQMFEIFHSDLSIDENHVCYNSKGHHNHVNRVYFKPIETHGTLELYASVRSNAYPILNYKLDGCKFELSTRYFQKLEATLDDHQIDLITAFENYTKCIFSENKNDLERFKRLSQENYVFNFDTWALVRRNGFHFIHYKLGDNTCSEHFGL